MKRSQATNQKMSLPPTIFESIPSTATPAVPLPPKTFKSPPLLAPQPFSQHDIQLPSRRQTTVLLSVLLSPLVHLRPASAFSFGISGPKDWLKEQKKKSFRFLLAPVDASRNSLRSAYLLLSKDLEISEKEVEEVKNLVNSAARDCVIQDRNSFVAFQAKTGVEVCTFRLIVNNAASLLADKDPLKLEAETRLTDLIRSFASLSNMANEIDVQVASNRRRVTDALTDAILNLDNFEQGIKDCLEI